MVILHDRSGTCLMYKVWKIKKIILKNPSLYPFEKAIINIILFCTDGKIYSFFLFFGARPQLGRRTYGESLKSLIFLFLIFYKKMSYFNLKTYFCMKKMIIILLCLQCHLRTIKFT